MLLEIAHKLRRISREVNNDVFFRLQPSNFQKIFNIVGGGRGCNFQLSLITVLFHHKKFKREKQ